MVITEKFTHVEVQNRPLTFNYLAKKLPASIALSLHFHNDPQVMKGLKAASQRQKVLNRAAAIYCVSNFIREQYIEGLNEGLEKVHVVYNGLDTQKKYGDKKEKIILFVGRIIPQKGALPLAQALSMVAKSLPDWQFVVSGESKKGSVTPYERSTRESLVGLGQQCLYTGYIQHSEVMSYFGKAEITVVPSIFEEPFGRTALEALACSSALITSGSGGLAEIVGDVGGIVVNPVTPENLAQAILGLAKDDVARKIIQENGYSRAVDIFDIRRVANQLDYIRQGLLPIF
jgi:glycosyltransferase involved in cell wall biosynthesis